jgi:hypothetical protein
VSERGRGRGGSGSGAPPTVPQRRGLFDALFAPRPASSAMPSLRRSLGRGMVTALGTPALVVGVPLVLLVEWLILVASGFQGPFAIMVHAFALPPLGTLTDVTLTSSVFGPTSGLIAIGVVLITRGILLAFVAAAAVDALRFGAASRWSAVRALRLLPLTLAINLLSLSLLLLQQIIAGFVGGGIGLLVFIGGLVFGVSWLSFAPAIAATEDRRLTEAISRSVRAARMPASGNLTLAAIYVIPAVALLLAPGKPGGLIGVNPSVGAWVLVIVANLLHVGVTAAFAYRYLAAADQVPEAPVRARPARRGG